MPYYMFSLQYLILLPEHCQFSYPANAGPVFSGIIPFSLDSPLSMCIIKLSQFVRA